MRIAIVLKPALPTNGGEYSYNRALLDALLRDSEESGHDYVLVDLWRDSKKYTPPHTRPPAEILALRSLRWVRRLLAVEARLPRSLLSQGLAWIAQGVATRVLRRHGIAAVYYFPYSYILTRRLPYATSVWDLGHRTVPQFAETGGAKVSAYRERNLVPLLAEAALVFTESAAGSAEVARYYGVAAARTVVMPMFGGSVTQVQPTKAACAAFLDAAGLHPYKFVFYPAQFWAHKNHLLLIEALRIVRTVHGLSLTLVLTGSDKGYRAAIEQACDAAALSRVGEGAAVRFLGFVDDETLAMLYRTALALVFPSWLGPTNMPILEAMQCGCPVICSDLEGHREQTHHLALYAAPDDAAGFAAHIVRLYTDAALHATLTARAADALVRHPATPHAAARVFGKAFAGLEATIREDLTLKNTTLT